MIFVMGCVLMLFLVLFVAVSLRVDIYPPEPHVVEQSPGLALLFKQVAHFGDVSASSSQRNVLVVCGGLSAGGYISPRAPRCRAVARVGAAL